MTCVCVGGVCTNSSMQGSFTVDRQRLRKSYASSERTSLTRVPPNLISIKKISDHDGNGWEMTTKPSRAPPLCPSLCIIFSFSFSFSFSFFLFGPLSICPKFLVAFVYFSLSFPTLICLLQLSMLYIFPFYTKPIDQHIYGGESRCRHAGKDSGLATWATTKLCLQAFSISIHV